MQVLLALLLIGSAWSQTSPSIEEILGEKPKSATDQHRPEPGTGPDSSPAARNSASVYGQYQDAASPAASQVGGGQQPRGGFGPQQRGGAPQKPPSVANVMSSLLGGSVHGGHSGGGKISKRSQLIVSGIVESFMHRLQLLDGEKACLERNLAQLAADVVGTGQDLVTAIKALIPHGHGRSQGPWINMNEHAQGTLASTGMDGAVKLMSLVTMSTSLMKNCVRGDAVAMLNATARHFINMSYVGHRLLVSGVDIAHSMSDGIIAFEHHDWRRFGADIGTSLRKVLLSNATNGTTLPEGVPEQSIIQKASEGLMDGFFVRGSSVEITDAARPDVDIKLDLHRCIAGNQEFFKEIFLAIWSFIAQMSANGEQHGFQNPFTSSSPSGQQPKWMGELMMAMMQVPMALGRCNVGQDSQQMLLEAIKSIQYLKVDFHFPRYRMRADEATKRMAMAIDKWTTWDFEGFGFEIGRLLREFVLTVYPQAYSVDASGRLRRQVIGESTPSGLDVSRAGGPPYSLASLTFFLAGVAFSMLAGLLAMRAVRRAGCHEYRDPSAVPEGLTTADAELASNSIAVE